MGETAVSSRSVRRLHGVVEEQVKDPAKVVNAEDETEEAAERRASKRGQSVRSSKRKGKQAEEEVVTRELMGTDVVDAVSLELRSLKLNDDCYGNSRSSGIVLNAVPQEFVASMERSLARGDDAASASSSGEGGEDDGVMDLESAAEQGYTSTALSRKDTAFLAELTRVIQRGGNWKKLTVPHMKAYLRHHGLRISASKLGKEKTFTRDRLLSSVAKVTHVVETLFYSCKLFLIFVSPWEGIGLLVRSCMRAMVPKSSNTLLLLRSCGARVQSLVTSCNSFESKVTICIACTLRRQPWIMKRIENRCWPRSINVVKLLVMQERKPRSRHPNVRAFRET